MKKIHYLFYFSVLAAGAVVLANRDSQEPRILSRVEAGPGHPGVVELLSAPYQIDRKYQSMEGPMTVQAGLKLSPERGGDETMMLTGVESEVVTAENLEVISPEFFCHSNLTLAADTTNPDAHNSGFTPATHADWRLFTLVPGRLSMRLPPGFGIPIKNGTELDYLTMVLNQNEGRPDQKIRIRTRVHYAEADKQTRALFRRAAYVYLAHQETPVVEVKTDPSVHAGAKCGEVCRADQKAKVPSLFTHVLDDSLKNHPGASCCIENASEGGIVPQFGSNNTIHWMVPPGKHRYTTEVTKQLNLPFDTTAHYITGHLHPTGVTMKLRDKDTGEIVAQIASTDFTDKIGVADMSEIRSEQGILFRKDGNYELEAEYDNKTGASIDAMAILYLYLAEKPPANAELGAVAEGNLEEK